MSDTQNDATTSAPDTSEETPRVGVFVCDCGTNIRATVDVPAVVEFARGLPDVVDSEEGKWICSVDYLNTIKEKVKEHNLNRVVVASCTPRTHESLFKKTVREAGMNPYLLEFVSIREQVSWVHRTKPEEGTEKAKDLVKAGVAKARLLEPGEEIKLPVGQECMVIGGGPAGMTAALAVADQGYKVRLVEREPELGGMLNKVSLLAPENVPASETQAELVAQVAERANIEVYTGAKLESIDGYIGNYKVKLSQGETPVEFDSSTVIVATGMSELDATGKFGYGDTPDVVTQLELEGLLRNGGVPAKNDVVMIQCVNSRNEERGCCAIGCTVAVKNAVAIKQANPAANVWVLYRDMITVKEEYAHLKEVMKEGIKFVRFAEDAYPEVAKNGAGLEVKVHDILLDKDLTIPADLVALTTGFHGPDGVDELKGFLKVSTNADGFFQESHIKLGPLDFPAAGVYLAGSARCPKAYEEVREEALGAAMRASIPMTRGFIEAEGIVADLDLSECSRCGLCAKNCPFAAIKMIDSAVEGEKPYPEVLKALCKGCGLCAADCPKHCIQIVHYSDEQILAQVDALLEEEPEKKIIAFVCHWCALGAVDIAGVGRFEYPTNTRIIRVMCSARVAHEFAERAFEKGAAGVLVAGCEFPTCHYITGNYKCKDRLERTRKKLAKKGYDTEKLWEVWLSAAMGPKWVATQKEMVHALGLDQ